MVSIFLNCLVSASLYSLASPYYHTPLHQHTSILASALSLVKCTLLVELTEIYLFIVCYGFLCIVSQARLDPVFIDVNEEEMFFEGCVVLEGRIERNVQIELSTVDDSAIGKCISFFIEN